ILLHALVNTSADVIRQINPLDTYVHEFDTEIEYVGRGLADHFSSHRRALGRDDLFQGALSDDALDPILHDLGDSLASELLAATGRLEIPRGILDLPLHVEVHDEAAIVVCEEWFAGIKLGQYPPIKLDDLVPRPLPVQAGRVIE